MEGAVGGRAEEMERFVGETKGRVQERHRGLPKIRTFCGVQGQDGRVGEGVREKERGRECQVLEEEGKRGGGQNQEIPEDVQEEDGTLQTEIQIEVPFQVEIEVLV